VNPDLTVFVPSLMGIGIIVSAALLISDGIRRLIPRRRLEHRHRVAVGTFVVVERAARAAGRALEPPSFLQRGLRSRAGYLVLGATLVAVGSAAIGIGISAYRDPLGVFFASPWALGLGWGIGSLAMLSGLVAFVLAVVHRQLPAPFQGIVTATWYGRLVVPDRQQRRAALRRVVPPEEVNR
jgi:hypothetical protein